MSSPNCNSLQVGTNQLFFQSQQKYELFFVLDSRLEMRPTLVLSWAFISTIRETRNRSHRKSNNKLAACRKKKIQTALLYPFPTTE